MDRSRSYRSLFWPILLIGVGVVFLLSNLGLIQPVNVATLWSLWPLILIVIGLDLLFGRRSPVIGGLIGLLAVAAVIVALLAGPALGLHPGGALQTRSFTEPVGAATAADVTLNFASQPVSLHTVSSSADLLEANIDYYGDLHYSSSGNPTRMIQLTHTSSGFDFGFDPNARWDIGLNPGVPIDLRLDGGSGSLELELSALDLSSFSLDQGSGSADVSLPAASQPYTAELQGGSGSLDLTLPANADLTVRLNRGSGSTSVSLPAGAAVRVEVRNSGSGSVSLPSGLAKLSGGSNSKEGVWQTSAYDAAAHKLNIICDDLGSGSFSMR